jgi:hypothetical protein
MRGLIELFVVAAFAIGWGVIELVALRYDKRRMEQAAADEKHKQQSDDTV